MAIVAPELDSISPTAGPGSGGTRVVLTGQYLTSVTAVQFGGYQAPSFTIDGDTQITAVSPAQWYGNVSVGVTAINQLFGAVNFTYAGTPISSTMTQISCGSQTNIWGVDAAGIVSQYNGSTWTQIPGGLKQVSVASDGTVWGTNAAGNVYSYRGSQANSWAQPAGVLSQVAVGSTSLVYGVNAAGVVYQYRGSQANSWAQVGTGMKQVSVASDGTVWATNAAGAVFQYAGNNTWTQIPTNVVAGGPNVPFTQVTVARNGFVWGLDAQGNSYIYSSGYAIPWTVTAYPLAKALSAAADRTFVLIDLQGITQVVSWQITA